MRKSDRTHTQAGRVMDRQKTQTGYKAGQNSNKIHRVQLKHGRLSESRHTGRQSDNWMKTQKHKYRADKAKLIQAQTKTKQDGKPTETILKVQNKPSRQNNLIQTGSK